MMLVLEMVSGETVCVWDVECEGGVECCKFRGENGKNFLSSGPPAAKKAKFGAVHMITTSDVLDDDSTEHPSKTVHVVSSDVEDADQSEDDDSDVDDQLEGAASSSEAASP